MTAGNSVLQLLNSSVILSISLTTALLGARLFALLRVGSGKLLSLLTSLNTACSYFPQLLESVRLSSLSQGEELMPSLAPINVAWFRNRVFADNWRNQGGPSQE